MTERFKKRLAAEGGPSAQARGGTSVITEWPSEEAGSGASIFFIYLHRLASRAEGKTLSFRNASCDQGRVDSCQREKWKKRWCIRGGVQRSHQIANIAYQPRRTSKQPCAILHSAITIRTRGNGPFQPKSLRPVVAHIASTKAANS